VQLYLLSLYQGRGRVLMKTAPGAQPMPILQANTAETNLRMALMRRAFFAHPISVELRRLLPGASDDDLFEWWYKAGSGTRYVFFKGSFQRTNGKVCENRGL
jgi:hypothetical protein